MKSYQIRIALQDVRPIVRRRILVPGDLNFAQLATILMCAMGWQGYHEYLFRFEDRNMTLMRGDESDGFTNAKISSFALQEGEKNAGEVKIDYVFKEGYSFWFDYDFGDGWRHGVKVEKIIDKEQGVAMVSQFEGNCPPEDVGGPGGYENFLRIINDEDDPEHEKVVEWGEFQTYEDYDADIINARLKALASKSYDEMAMMEAYEEALFETGDLLANTDAADDPDRGVYDGTGYRITQADVYGVDLEPGDDIPESFGPNCIWRVIERFDLMTNSEKNEVLQYPEVEFGFLSIARSHFTDLRSVLQGMDENELEGITESMNLSLSGKRGKPALVGAIYDFMADKNFFPAYMSTIKDEGHIALIHEIMTSKEPYRVTGSDYPYEVFTTLRGVLAVTSWWDGYDLLITPVDEMREKYAETIELVKDQISSAMDALDTCAKAVVNLYGIVSLQEFEHIFTSVTATDEDGDTKENTASGDMDDRSMREQLTDIIQTYEGGRADYFLSGDLLVSDALKKMKNHELKDLHKMFSANPRRALPRKIFLEYADWLYYEETEAHRKLRAYVERKVLAMKKAKQALPKDFPDDVAPVAVAEDIIKEASLAIRMNAHYKEILGIFENLGDGFETKDEEKEVLLMLAEISSHLRMWELGGATPEEMGEQTRIAMPYKKTGPKIGRNDPCPCGSGKKYKHCCGVH